jgi:hypothetical protein
MLTLPSTTTHSSMAQVGPEAFGASASLAAVTAASPPQSPADVRIALEELLGQHATLVVRFMRAKVKSDPDFLDAATNALVANTDDLAGIFTQLGGTQASDAFRKLWTAHISLLFNYAVGVVEKDQPGKDRARAGLDQYRADFGSFIQSLSRGTLPASAVAAGLKTHIDQLTGQIDAYAAQDYGLAYQLEGQAYAHMLDTGKTLAQGLALPGQSPAPANDPSLELRSGLGRMLGQHFELLVDTTRAAVTSAPDFQAAAAALDGNTKDITAAMDGLFGAAPAKQFNQAWADHIEYLVRYTVAVATKNDQARTAEANGLAGYRQVLGATFSAATGGRVAPDAVAGVLATHDGQVRQEVDAYASKDYKMAHDISLQGYQHMFDTAGVLATAIVAAKASQAPKGGVRTGGGGMAGRLYTWSCPLSPRPESGSLPPA